MLTVERLLAGPRGRRLLLEIAQASDAAEAGVSRSIADASYALARAHGQAVFRFGWGGQGRLRSVADVVRALADLELGPLTVDDFWRALTASVDSAMYWQEPDGDDLLARIPEVTAELEGVAESVLASAPPAWWGTPPPAGDQWQLRYDHQQATVPPLDLGEWRRDCELREARAVIERAGPVQAPLTGRWWSRPPHGLRDSTRMVDSLPVGLRLVEDSSGRTTATATRLDIPAWARIYEVNSASAWAELCRDFPLEVTAQYRHDWYRTTGREGRWVIPDWAAVAERYDGVHLSVEGYLEAATTAIPVSDGWASVIAGCDPDTTWWFNDAVTPTGETRSVRLPD